MTNINSESEIKLTLLGTGTPIPDKDRHGPSQIIELGKDNVLVDCGAGTLHRLLEAGTDVHAISHVLLTHLHSDHISGLNDFLWAGWVGRWWDIPPILVGPPDTKQFIDRLLHAFEEDIRLRSAEGAVTINQLRPEILEIEDGWSISHNNWRVRGFRVDHFPVRHAFGYKFEFGRRILVVSGDTRMCQSLIDNAFGADILVNEVAWEKGIKRSIEESQGAQRARMERIMSYHISSKDVGKVASMAQVKHLVLSHLMLAGGTPDDLIQDVRIVYCGKVTVGEDLAQFSTAEP